MPSERRDKLRVDNELPVWIHNRELHTSNISLAGMQVSFPSLTDGRPISLESDKLPATITLPNKERVRTRCRMVYLSDDGEQVLAGLQITGFEEEDFRIWAEYVNDLLYN